jgi:uncharacterized membrane protein
VRVPSGDFPWQRLPYHGFSASAGFLSRHSAIILIIIAATVIRFAGLGHKQLWVDEIIQVLHSSPDSFEEILRHVATNKGAAPFDYFVQHYFMKALGSWLPLETSARFHAALFGSISVALIYALAFRLLRNRRIAVFSAGVYALFPLHHHYSQEGRLYALFVLLIVVLFILNMRTRRHCSWKTLCVMTLCSALCLLGAFPCWR